MGTNHECMLNKPKLLFKFQNFEEIYEAKLLTQIGDDNPEQILPVHSGGCVRTLRSC